MAATVITPVSLKFNESKAAPTLAATDATDGTLIPYGHEDRRILLILKNDSQASMSPKIKKGDSVQAAAADLTLTIAAGATHYIVIESGPYKFVNDTTKKGNVHVTGTADLDIGAVYLP